MTAVERELEEDEAKLDNLLHKIIECSDKIKLVADSLESEEPETCKEKLHLLADSIYNLALLADEIDVKDEEITEELEARAKEGLNSAIGKIKEF